jgi:flagellar basal body rod protein FlgG
MIKGLYAAASAMLANLSRHGTLSHNVANLDTPGFKEVLVSLDDWVGTTVVHPPGPTAGPSQLRWIGNLGLGVETTPEINNFAQGGMRVTGMPLDVAVEGPGFFRVETPNGERYTRDGRFMRDMEGNLVTVDGYFVLDDGGGRINIPEGEVSITPDGVITVNGQQAGQIGLAAFENPEAELTRDLPNTFAAAGEPTGEETGAIQQGALEMSNANPAQIMSQMVAVSRAYEAAQKMVQNQDELLGRTISTLGRL